MNKVIKNITKQFIDRYNPQKLLLFGSVAKNTTHKDSDVDLCVIIDTQDKRKLLTDMYANIVADSPFDLLLYTPDEWTQCLDDNCSFAHKINTEGIMLYAR